MDIYKIITMERPYDSGKYVQNELTMTEKRFQDFLMAVNITKAVDEETGEFTGYDITFNSGLRHTACRVTSISRKDELLYCYGAHCTIEKFFDIRLEAVCNSKSKKQEAPAAA